MGEKSRSPVLDRWARRPMRARPRCQGASDNATTRLQERWGGLEKISPDMEYHHEIDTVPPKTLFLNIELEAIRGS